MLIARVPVEPLTAVLYVVALRVHQSRIRDYEATLATAPSLEAVLFFPDQFLCHGPILRGTFGHSRTLNFKLHHYPITAYVAFFPSSVCTFAVDHSRVEATGESSIEHLSLAEAPHITACYAFRASTF